MAHGVQSDLQSVLLSNFLLLLQAGTHSSLSTLLRGLPDSLYKQYSYELPHINSGAQLLHSPFFQSLISLACNLELDTLDTCRDSMRWQWFHQYCTAARMCRALQRNTALPPPIARSIAEKVSLLKVAKEQRDQTYLNPQVFSHEHDKQLVLWMQRCVWVCQEGVWVCVKGCGCQWRDVLRRGVRRCVVEFAGKAF